MQYKEFTYDLHFNKDNNFIKSVDALYTADKNNKVYKNFVNKENPPYIMVNLDNNDNLNNVKSFESDLINFYAIKINRFIYKNKKYFYKIFKNNFIDIVSENTYNKLKHNVINYFTEMPFTDIFDISFNRFLNSEKDFNKIISKISKYILYMEYDYVMTVTCYDRKTINSVINIVDNYYLSLYQFRKLIDDKSNFIEFDPGVTEHAYKHKANIYIHNKNETKQIIENAILNMIILFLRDSFRSLYIQDIKSGKDKTLNNILTDIISFYIRNGATLKKSINTTLDIINYNFYNNFDKKILDLIIPKHDESIINYEKFEYEGDIAVFLAPLQELIGKIGAISHLSSLKIADSFIDVEPLSSAIQELSSKLIAIKVCNESLIYNKYLTNGFKDTELIEILRNCLKVYIKKAFSIKQNKTFKDINLSISTNSKFIKTVVDNGIKVLMNSISSFGDFNYDYFVENFEKKYGQEIFPQLLKDLDSFIYSFNELMISFVNIINDSFMKHIEKWLNSKMIINCEKMIHYDCSVDIDNVEIESCMDNNFLSMNDEIFKSFLLKYSNKYI